MGEVLVTLKIMPEDMGQFDSLKQAILDTLKNKTGGLVKSAKLGEQDVAFGMKAIVVSYVMPDGDGASKIEAQISALPNVSSCETESVDRL
ncbi:MAG: elongation factor 1-beta [Candidatus Micrarchaeota archaeon]